jgi:hypothetical protein
MLLGAFGLKKYLVDVFLAFDMLMSKIKNKI